MKAFVVLLKIFVVGIIWSVLFVEGIRVILFTNWHFDIFRGTHWTHAWNLWRSGWIIDETKEWAFILIILTAIPVWATVWGALSIISWEKIGYSIKRAVRLFLNKLNFSATKKNVKSKVVQKTVTNQVDKPQRSAKAYVPLEKATPNLSPEKRAQLSGIPVKMQIQSKTAKAITKAPIIEAKPAVKEFSHSLFELDNEDTFDFDLFDEKPNEGEIKKANNELKKQGNFDTEPVAKKKKNDGVKAEAKPKNYHSSSTLEVLKQKGYEIISGVTLRDVFVDFVGISKNQICLCINDKETGDWLADEERFNDEEPLWFSESSHRISPVRKVAIAQEEIMQRLSSADLNFKVVSYVIEQIGNIINAEDMFDIWKSLKINVTRIDRGTPKEIPLFAKKLEDAGEGVSKEVLEKITKILRNDD